MVDAIELNHACLVLPRSLASSLEALDASLLRVAVARQISNLAMRVSGLSAIGGSPGEAWTVELHGAPKPLEIASSLSFGDRETLAMRVHRREDVVTIAAHRFEGGNGVARTFLAGTLDEAERLLADALGPLVGEPVEPKGFLMRWLAAHDANAVARVVRWEGAKPKEPGWPSRYADPSWLGLVDEEAERSILKAACMRVAKELSVHFLELEKVLGGAKQARGAIARQSAKDELEVAKQRFIGVVRAATGPRALDTLFEPVLVDVLEAEGVKAPRVRAVMKTLGA